MRVLVLAAAFAAVSCAHYTPYTAQQLIDRGTHCIAGVSAAQALDGSATALTTLGYTVTLKNAEQGVVKTAPKTIMVSATGVGNSANATDDGIAWSIQIETAGGDVVLHAVPRAFRNGSEIHDEGIWVAEVMDSKFQDLWNEIDSTLGVKPAPAPAAAK